MFNKSRGVHPAPHKNTENFSAVPLEGITHVQIPMNMQIGPGCKPCVKIGDEVKIGQLIGEPIAPMSVPIHASISGTVQSVKKIIKSDGQVMDTVEIVSDGQNTLFEELSPPQIESKEDFVAAVRASGLVGLGGAGFPTHFKLSPPPDKKLDLLLINAMECEPYITSDDQLTCQFSDEIIAGIEHVMKWLAIERTIIGIENNTPVAEAALTRSLNQSDYKDRISVISLVAQYPLGAEKVLIRNMAKREVPSGGLPHDVGVLVLNVGTVRYIAHYLRTGLPLTRKFVTLDGSALNQPGNYDIPIGTIIADAIELTGGFKTDPQKIIMGGPMMGIAVDSPDAAIIKNNNAILCFDPDDAEIADESACIRCGRCVRGCPMYLMPTDLDIAARLQDLDRLNEFSVMDCIECGSCSYICPSKRFLVQNIRVGKMLLRQAAQLAKAKAEQEKISSAKETSA